VVVDGVNSSGGIIIPKLLELMGVEVVKLYCEPNGHFNQSLKKEHLTDISELVVKEKADLVVDQTTVWLSSVKMVKCLEKNILWWLVLIMY
jgi:hypothetical protein